jgi:hypothetical protein
VFEHPPYHFISFARGFITGIELLGGGLVFHFGSFHANRLTLRGSAAGAEAMWSISLAHFFKSTFLDPSGHRISLLSTR